jgi:hypothetical protein
MGFLDLKSVGRRPVSALPLRRFLVSASSSNTRIPPPIR